MKMKEKDFSFFSSLTSFDLDSSDMENELENMSITSEVNHMLAQPCIVGVPKTCGNVRLIKEFLEYELGHS